MCKRVNNKNFNTKRRSRFICLRCLQENKICAGIIRPNTRDKGHIKNLYCLCTKMQYKTKNLEVRYKDDYQERMEYAKKIRPRFYNVEGNYIGEYDEECLPMELK